jgi:hypothetical protein
VCYIVYLVFNIIINIHVVIHSTQPQYNRFPPFFKIGQISRFGKPEIKIGAVTFFCPYPLSIKLSAKIWDRYLFAKIYG